MTSYEIHPKIELFSKVSLSRKRVPRVLHILEATLGGTMRYLENLLHASTDMDIDTGFAYAVARADHQLAPMLQQAECAGWQLYPIDMHREITVYRDLIACWQLAGAIRCFRPDIIHCHSSKAGALGRIASFACSPRPEVVYSPHALAGKPHHLFIEQTLKRVTRAFVAVSESERDQIASYNLADPEEIEVLYPVIDADHFHPADRVDARRQLNLPNRPIVLGIGRLTKQKDPLCFLRIISQLRAHLPDVLGVWVGDGEQHHEVVAAAKRLNLNEAFLLAGWQSDVRPYIAASDVLLSTSKFESFGYMVAEALAMERPVVATRVCGTVDILSGQLAVNLFDDFEQAVTLLLRVLKDQAFARSFGSAGRLEIKTRFSVSQMRLRLLTYYQTLLPALTTDLLPSAIEATR